MAEYTPVQLKEIGALRERARQGMGSLDLPGEYDLYFKLAKYPDQFPMELERLRTDIHAGPNVLD